MHEARWLVDKRLGCVQVLVHGVELGFLVELLLELTVAVEAEVLLL